MPALQEQHRLPDRLRLGDGIDGVDAPPVACGQAHRQLRGGGIEAGADRTRAFDQATQGNLLGIVDHPVVEQADATLLLDDEVEQGPCRCREQDHACHIGRAACDARREHAALAVAEYEDAAMVDEARLSQGGDRLQRVIGRFAVDGELVVREQARIPIRALLVTQYGNAAFGQALCDVAERLVRGDGLVAIMRTGTVHQHDSRKWTGTVRQRQGARQAICTTDPHLNIHASCHCELLRRCDAQVACEGGQGRDDQKSFREDCTMRSGHDRAARLSRMRKNACHDCASFSLSASVDQDDRPPHHVSILTRLFDVERDAYQVHVASPNNTASIVYSRIRSFFSHFM